MAVRTTNLATLYLGAHEVARIVSLVQDDPENQMIFSEALTDTTPDLLGVDPPTTGRTLTLTVEVDDADTNGQLALDAAKTSRAKITGAIFYPYGKITGNPKYTGDLYVVSSGQVGSTGNVSKARQKTYKLAWAAEPTLGTES